MDFTKTQPHRHAKPAMMPVQPAWHMVTPSENPVHQITTCNRIAIPVAKHDQMEHMRTHQMHNEQYVMKTAQPATARRRLVALVVKMRMPVYLMVAASEKVDTIKVRQSAYSALYARMIAKHVLMALRVRHAMRCMLCQFRVNEHE